MPKRSIAGSLSSEVKSQETMRPSVSSETKEKRASEADLRGPGMRGLVLRSAREIDPIHDPGWRDFIEWHPRASIFHTPGWLEALRRTYGYRPLVLTTSRHSQEVTNGVVFCRVSSWLTGTRIVSLPFSDHCEPLVDGDEALRSILAAVSGDSGRNGRVYVEMRPLEMDMASFAGFSKSQSFCVHRLDLGLGLPDIFGGFHKDCVRRKIRRAEREGLSYEAGRSPELVEKFYRLLVLTRRRQLLLPQPLAWFKNLVACLGERLKIHVVSRQGQSVASILTLTHKSTIVYKYGCSDKQFSNLGGTQMIFWKMIQDAKRIGLQQLDMGRSDWNNLGLVRFKDRWGAARSNLSYWRYGAARAPRAEACWNSRIVRSVFGHAPGGFLTTTGALMYRHMG